MGKIPKNILAVAALGLLAVWLLPLGDSPNSDSQNAESQVSENGTSELASTDIEQGAKRIVSGSFAALAQAASNPVTLSQAQSEDLSARFTQANQKLVQGDEDQAIEMYKALTEEFPNFVEPYVNLAAAYANRGDLEQARSTLAQGTRANQSTQLLFDSINKVHGALAAQAYKNALESGEVTAEQVSLPTSAQLATDFELTQQVKKLSDALEQQQNLQSAAVAIEPQLKKLKVELQQTQESAETSKLEYQQQLSAMQTQLDAKAQQAELAQAQLSNMQSQAEKAESDLLAKMRIELGNSESALQGLQKQLTELSAQNEDLTRQLVAAQTAAAQVVASNENSTQAPLTTTPASTTPAIAPQVSTEPPKKQPLSENQTQTAIALVQAWASSWSSQDVPRYLSYYVSDYSSSENQSHKTWADQRRVRLTNKKFIQVTVSNFNVEKTTQGFAVTFTQNYRSDTLDDSIVKQISYAISENQDWSSAKIISERIVSL